MIYGIFSQHFLFALTHPENKNYMIFLYFILQFKYNLPVLSLSATGLFKK